LISASAIGSIPIRSSRLVTGAERRGSAMTSVTEAAQAAGERRTAGHRCQQLAGLPDRRLMGSHRILLLHDCLRFGGDAGVIRLRRFGVSVARGFCLSCRGFSCHHRFRPFRGWKLLLISADRPDRGSSRAETDSGMSETERGTSSQAVGNPRRSVKRLASASSMRFCPYRRLSRLEALIFTTALSRTFDPLRDVSTCRLARRMFCRAATSVNGKDCWAPDFMETLWLSLMPVSTREPWQFLPLQGCASRRPVASRHRFSLAFLISWANGQWG
jgi:hypothetical protein